MTSIPAASGPVGRAPLGAPFWRLFASSACSNLSDGVLLAAVPLMAATLTRDPLAVSVLMSLEFLPWLLFALPAGTLVDRVNRRTAMAVTNVARALLLAALAMAVMTGVASLPLLYVCAFALGCAETVYDSAALAMLPTVVARPQLERGNSLLSTAESVANIFLGAPVGAWLFAFAASMPFWGNASAYLVAAGLALAVAGKFRPERTERTTVRADMAEGLRWLRRHRLLRNLMLTSAVAGLAQSMVNGILVLFALQNLGLSEQAFGLLLAAAGVGAVLGSLLAPRLAAWWGRGAAMGVAGLVGAVGTLAMAAFQGPVAGPALFAAVAAAVSAFSVLSVSLRQALVPDALFGRVQGAYRMVIWGAIPVGSLVGGALGAAWGLTSVVAVSGALGAVAALATWAVLHRHRDAISAAYAADPGEDPRLSAPTGG